MLQSEVGASFVGCDDQGELTPFQRQMIEQAKAVEAEERERKRQQQTGQQQTGPSRPKNARAGSNGGGDLGQEETVRYINKQQNPDHPAVND